MGYGFYTHTHTHNLIRFAIKHVFAFVGCCNDGVSKEPRRKETKKQKKNKKKKERET
jgi:hypothetical protein